MIKKIFLLFLFLSCFPTILFPETLNNKKSVEKPEEYTIPILPESPNNDVNKEFYKQNLKLNMEKEDLARRGEITFFSSLSYLWAYQLIFMDIFFSAQFNDNFQSGKLSFTNFVYSILTSILVALMVTRKDTQFLQVTQYKEPATAFIADHGRQYREDIYEWKFNISFMSYDF